LRLQEFQRQVRLSSAMLARADAVEVALEGAGVVDLESLLLLLEPDEAWPSGAGGDMAVS
jgi:hypothetical protein